MQEHDVEEEHLIGPGILLQTIHAAITDRAFRAAKLDKLVQLEERLSAREAKAEFAKALAVMQTELPVIEERGVIEARNGRGKRASYALWEDINDAIKPVLARHGFALSFRTDREKDEIIVIGILRHESGHSEETVMRLPADGSAGKNGVQAVGSSTSYGKRYAAAALLNLTSRGEDDDGDAACRVLIGDEQRAQLERALKKSGGNVRRFCRFLNVERLADVSAADFERALRILQTKGRAA